MTSPPHVLEVSADFACFTRPELKAERWSYPCPTPSAARGVFDAIYVKPVEFRWQVTKIELLSWPSYIALRRNEVKEVVSTSAVKKWIKGSAQPEPIWADASGEDFKGRTQRQTMALREPRFRIHGRIVPWPGYERQQTAFDEQFRRRARQGKCFHQPYLGCREFVCFFRLIEEQAAEPPPVDHSQDLGFMVYDVFDLRQPQQSDARPFISVFPARIEQGVLTIPPYDSPEVRKPESGQSAERRVG